MTAEALTEGGSGHEHLLRLVAVHLEDGSSTREFCCETCQAVWFA